MAQRRMTFSLPTAHEEPMVNLTPLIDVVFVILIMFIVIAPLLELDQIELAEGPLAPQNSVSPVQENSPITIHVHADNAIWFNNQTMNPTELLLHLREAKIKFPNAHPQLFHDKKAHFGTYQAVKNATESAGFSRMDIILQPS